MLERTTLAARLADFIVELRYEDLPESVVAKAKECVLDQLGVQVKGSTQLWNQPVAKLVQRDGGKDEATVINHGYRVPAHAAAYANATFGQGCELDDYLGAKADRASRRIGSVSGHAGAISIPTALALAEASIEGPVNGRDLLTAVVLGYEIMGSLVYPMRSGIHERGFHLDSAVGVFGAAATASKLLGLDPTKTMHALSIAGSHASGTMEYDQSGGEVKRLHSGLAARAGVQSAMLARNGLTGPATIFEGPRGVLRAFGEYEGDAAVVLEGLGEEYLIEAVGFKVHPVRSGIAGSLDAAQQIIDKEKFQPEDIVSVTVTVANWVSGWHSMNPEIYHPADAIGAQMSLPFALALLLVRRSDDLSLFTDPQSWNDPQILRVAKAIHIQGDASLDEGPERHKSVVKIVLVDGRSLSASQTYTKGSTNNPLTWEEVVGKFNRLTGDRVAEETSAAVVEVVGGLERLVDGATIVPMLSD